ncbi:hypothetical protein INR49_006794 [Caranx melampygus]|nr:hypothetical protein INR49_006794 [Caranx melampygus]
MKPPTQSQSPPVNSLVFEGVYNNARMLHFLTAVVGSTCDVRVKNGSVYEGIFKTLSSQVLNQVRPSPAATSLAA